MFFSRDFTSSFGGISEGDFKSLNVSYMVQDNPKNVDYNRELITKFFKVNKEKLFTVKQVHSTTIIEATKNSLNADFANKECDGIYTNAQGLLLGIITADCLPILIVDVKEKKIAAIHCGWKGLLNGIIENTLKQMSSSLTNKSNLLVAIGPSIKQPSYEVDVEFYENFLSKDLQANKFFLPNNNKFLFDLSGYAKYKLEAYGVAKENIEILPNDTFLEKENFFSHRRMVKNSENARGLQISCIILK